MACKHSFNIPSGCFSSYDCYFFLKSEGVFFSSVIIFPAFVEGICRKVQNKYSYEQDANWRRWSTWIFSDDQGEVLIKIRYRKEKGETKLVLNSLTKNPSMFLAT